MNTLKFLLLAAFCCCVASADMTVVSVDTNGVSNVSALRTTTVGANMVYSDRLSLTNGLYVDSRGVVYVPVENREILLKWPTFYRNDYTNYPGNNRDYVDPLVTEWFMNRAIDGLRADLLVFGDKDFYVRYTNSPPSNIQSLLGYVSNCVYLLSNVEVQMSYNTVSNDIEELKTRVTRTEVTTDHFGAGVTDLDYIISSNIEDMDAEVMLDMIKTLATYIKNGSTNTVETSQNSEPDTTEEAGE